MLPKLQNTLHSKQCVSCLSINLLSMYDNGRGGGEETTKEFSLKNKQLSLKGRCYENQSLGVFFSTASLQFLWILRVYIIQVKDIRVTLKIVLQFISQVISQVGQAASDSRNALIVELPHVLFTWPSAGAIVPSQLWDQQS